MAQSSLPGVTVDEGRISDFLQGIQGSARTSNARARRFAEDLAVGVVAYTAVKAIKRKKGRK